MNSRAASLGVLVFYTRIHPIFGRRYFWSVAKRNHLSCASGKNKPNKTPRDAACAVQARPSTSVSLYDLLYHTSANRARLTVGFVRIPAGDAKANVSTRCNHHDGRAIHAIHTIRALSKKSKGAVDQTHFRANRVIGGGGGGIPHPNRMVLLGWTNGTAGISVGRCWICIRYRCGGGGCWTTVDGGAPYYVQPLLLKEQTAHQRRNAKKSKKRKCSFSPAYARRCDADYSFPAPRGYEQILPVATLPLPRCGPKFCRGRRLVGRAG